MIQSVNGEVLSMHASEFIVATDLTLSTYQHLLYYVHVYLELDFYFKKPFKFKTTNKIKSSVVLCLCTRIRNQYVTFEKMAFVQRLFCTISAKERPI